MTFLKAIIMGLIQGITEFLPVSSSGHLAIFRNIFNYNTEVGIFFEALLHLGTLISVWIVFYKDINKLIIAGFKLLANIFNALRKKITWKDCIENQEQKFVLLIIISTLVTVLFALFIKDFAVNAYDSLVIPSIGLIITGSILLFASKQEKKFISKKNIEDMTLLDALLVGLAQAVAVLPGISRSGSTIAVSQIRQVKREEAVRYSFILGIPAIIGANILEFKDIMKSPIHQEEIFYYISGMVVAAIVGYISIKFLLDIVKKGKLYYFAYYCYGIAALVILYSIIN